MKKLIRRLLAWFIGPALIEEEMTKETNKEIDEIINEFEKRFKCHPTEEEIKTILKFKNNDKKL